MRAVLLALSVLLVTAASAQTYEPARGTAERSAILDAVRAETSAQHEVSSAITFFDVEIRVQGDWAYFGGDPRRPNGTDLGHCEPDWDSQMIALLYRVDGRWSVLEAGACASDVWFLHWPARYGAPDAVVGFGMSEPLPLAAEVAQTDDGFLSLRTHPSVRTGERITRMSSGSALRVLECAPTPEAVGGRWGRWCRVEHGGETGWAFSAYIVMY